MQRFQRGLTLVEMLVALTVFSIIAVTSIVLMRLGIDSDEQLQNSAELITEFQIARSLIKGDLAQFSRRQTRNEIGQLSSAPVVGGAFDLGASVLNEESETLLLAFVSNGRFNPGNTYAQSSLQYVEYWVADNKVLRRVWPYLDRVEETPHSEQILFSDVENVSISFLDGSRWVDQWQSRAGTLAPRAMDLTFDHPTLGPVNQLFFVEGVAI